MKHGSLRRLAPLVVVSFSVLCASCVPMSLQYYVPSAEGAKVVSNSCSGNPPYEANFFGGISPRFNLKVGLVQQSLTAINNPTLTVIIDPGVNAHVAIDPKLIRVEADGQSVVPQRIHYLVGKARPTPTMDAVGPIDIEGNYLIIHMPVGISGSLDVVTHLPPVTVGGQIIQFPDVSFKLEKHTQIVMIAGNC